MDKEEFKKLAQNPNFISGIYNYCDRWCERCPFTARCLNFAMSEAEGDDPESHDIESEAFWKKLESSLQLAAELLIDLAKEKGIDLDAIEETEELYQQQQRHREQTASHALSLAAMKYIKMVDGWFKTNREIFEQRQKELQTEWSIGIDHQQLSREAESIVDANEVIGWYQHQIYVKIRRALSGLPIEPDEDPIQNDANGSAKVALIGIERSIGAWAKLTQHFPDQTDSILDILLHLDRLKKKLELEFPNARIFKRPGFDD